MQRTPGVTAVGAMEHIMDAKDHVKRDILHFFRTYKAQTISRDFGPFEVHTRGYSTQWKDALQAALDDLAAEGLMEMQGRKLVLTAQGREKVLS
jgi:hypothetical protein